MDESKIVSSLINKGLNLNQIEQVLVLYFIKINNIPIESKHLFENDYQSMNQDVLENCFATLKQLSGFCLDDLVMFFELLVPSDTKKETGAVYTPSIIKKYILNECSLTKSSKIIDPSCGCGSFLVTAAEIIHLKYKKAFVDIFKENLFGIDIDRDALRKAKVLLTLLANKYGDNSNFNFNLYCHNSLDNIYIDKLSKENDGFDFVVGNPPYVRSKNMDENTKKMIINWPNTANGNTDLYFPFFEIAFSLVKRGGKIGYISPNSFLQGVNARYLRDYLVKQRMHISIVDFRDQQMFKKVTSYTCITIIDTRRQDDFLDYCRSFDSLDPKNINFTSYKLSNFPNGKVWRIINSEYDEIIFKLENSDNPLSNWTIRNGLATLKNNLFFFVPEAENEKYFFRTYRDKKYKIEKSICIPMVKPNVIKTEDELKNNREVAIFPYERKNGKPQIIEENVLSQLFPETYKLLLDAKPELLKRDKGHGVYPTWYAYGRTQGMNNFGKKLLIPYISGGPVAVLSLNPDLLFYCGYALISDDLEDLCLLRVFLKSDAFWFFIYHTSKPYSKGYMALAKNYIVRFSIPELSQSEKEFLLHEKNKEKLNEWIWNRYGIFNIPK